MNHAGERSMNVLVSAMLGPKPEKTNVPIGWDKPGLSDPSG